MKATLFAAFLSFGSSAFAGSLLAISPSSSTASIGSAVSIDIKVADLASDVSVGVFDIEVVFDPAVLSFSSGILGSQLDLLGLGSVQSITPVGSGRVGVFELSLDSVDDLNSLQLPAFRLVTLTFDAIAAGSSALTLSVNAIGDASGNPIAAEVLGASVLVAGVVPEPSTYALMLAGLGFGVAARRVRLLA